MPTLKKVPPLPLKPRLPVGERRISVTVTLLPRSLDVLDGMVERRQCSRGRILDDLLASLALPSRALKDGGGRAAS